MVVYQRMGSDPFPSFDYYLIEWRTLAYTSCIDVLGSICELEVQGTEEMLSPRFVSPKAQYQLSPRSVQGPHHALKRDQRHRVRRERAQETRREPPPIPPQPVLAIHGDGGVAPARIAAVRAQRVRHDALLDDVAGVAGDPEDLGAEAAGPEVDGGGAEGGVVLQRAGEDVVGAPPEEEEGAEEQRRRQAVPEPAHPVLPEDLVDAVDRPGVLPRRLRRLVLDLQPRLHVLDRRRDEADRPAREDTGHAMAQRRQSLALGRGEMPRRAGRPRAQRLEDVLVDQPAVGGERAQHERVHEHPSYQGGCGEGWV
nr:hypothetical protein CFP56_56942 [Quercus suber]